MLIRDILKSSVDDSINMIFGVPDHPSEIYEGRLVFRDNNTLIVYLSSMVGCNLSCRFCHLTQTNQTSDKEVSVDYILNIIEILLTYCKDHSLLKGITTLHYNFMARGDTFASKQIMSNSKYLFEAMKKISSKYLKDIPPKFKISTIFPNIMILDEEFDSTDVRHQVNSLLDLDKNMEIYYSLYSLKESFRKKWIPKAIDPVIVGNALHGLDYGIRLHYALIDGENDSEEDVALIHSWLEEFDLSMKLNIVRYNPFSDRFGKESPEESIKTYIQHMKLSHRITDVQF